MKAYLASAILMLAVRAALIAGAMWAIFPYLGKARDAFNAVSTYGL